MNQHKQSGIRLQDKDLEGYTKEKLKSIRATTLQDIGIATTNNQVDIERILDVVRAELDSLVEYVRQNIQPRTHKLQFALSAMHIENVRSKVQRQLGELENAERGALIDRDRIPQTYSWRYYFAPILAIVVLMTIDSLMNAKSMQILGGSLLVSSVLALVTVGALSFAAHALGKRIAEVKTKRAKIATFLLGVIGAGILFYFLGVLRNNYYQSLHQESYMTSPFFMAFWNAGFFAIAIYISARYFPSKEQWEERSLYNQHHKRYTEASKQRIALLAELTKAEKEYNESALMLGAWNVYEQDTISFILKEGEVIKRLAMKEYHLKGGKLTNQFDSESKQIEY